MPNKRFEYPSSRYWILMIKTRKPLHEGIADKLLENIFDYIGLEAGEI